MPNAEPRPGYQRYVPVVGPRLRILLYGLFALFALLSINSLYLLTIRIAEALGGQVYQDYFYQYMFLAHLLLGLVLIVPVIVYGILHIRTRPAEPARGQGRVRIVHLCRAHAPERPHPDSGNTGHRAAGARGPPSRVRHSRRHLGRGDLAVRAAPVGRQTH